MFILTLLLDSRGGAGKCLAEDGVNLLGCVWLVIELLDAVVREFAAFRGKEVMTFLKGCYHIGECSY